MNQEQLHAVVEACWAVDEAVDDSPDFSHPSAELLEAICALEETLATLTTVDCALCGTPIRGRQGVDDVRPNGTPCQYHARCYQEWWRGQMDVPGSPSELPLGNDPQAKR